MVVLASPATSCTDGPPPSASSAWGAPRRVPARPGCEPESQPRLLRALGVRTGLAIVVVALLALLASAGATPVSSADPEASVRIAAQRLGDGRMEFALQQRGGNGAWGERVLPTRRFFPAAPDLRRWVSSSTLTVRAMEADEKSDGTDVRIAARRLDDGRTEFALQVRGTGGAWGARALPTRRFFPATVSVGRWLSSSALAVALPTPKADGLPSEGTFKSISVGREHICGVRTNGAVACWGSNDARQATPPAGLFEAVSAGASHTCGVRLDGTVACWGGDWAGQAAPPPGSFTAVSAGPSYTCGVRLDGTLACWGDNRHGQASPPEGSFTSVSAGHTHACGLRTSGTLTCWGEDAHDQLSSPDGVSEAVSVGVLHACAVQIDGTIKCWGIERHPPAGTFTDVSVGIDLSCAITAAGVITCRGGPGSSAPAGTFVAVSAGYGTACALKDDGSVTCWGETFAGQASPPEGSFDVISSGRSNTCGIRDDADLACWGAGYFSPQGERVPPPGGSFRAVSAGDTHACAVVTDGSIACWGSDWNRPVDPAPGGLHVGERRRLA